MEKPDFIANLDNLVLSIEIVLSKNRSSLSIDDVIRLENVIVTLNELKKVSKVSDRKEILSEVLPVIIRTFFRSDVMEELGKVLEFLANL
ncbi:hypothetical protein [Maribacter cobaltidurans]|uniref:Uncharacterized protein n=1 Tax=Maribacter cobaltidurans TaxID=1178778 RepID=A0A223V3P3_9FLAO|nr:hypothetical protein [Maribacter cobaltidurans]ASV30043.1 hypothetical protein CJ263_07300 [Maribacter cobaltidurans]GGD87670.1 hypothetical protein GCM10011412_26840 [Maribacter cobaltidurans]|tara:strand:+ start:4571 stop:4840 length:270 start_codon:yes stop_codon:yes gene_type:complete